MDEYTQEVREQIEEEHKDFEPKLRTFWGLVATMFQGALSDNIYRFVLTMLAIVVAGLAAQESHVALGITDPVQLEEDTNALSAFYKTCIDVAFMLPYFLAVTLAGWLSDRFSKTRVTQGTKVLEIGIMVLAFFGFLFGEKLFGRSALWLGAFILFLMGLQSALFSPSKYGVLPEILPPRRLGWGNGILQGFTFFAIILGTIAGPWLYGAFEDSLWVVGLVLVGLATAGLVSSSFMDKTPVANPEETFRVNPLEMLQEYGSIIMSKVGLRWGALGLMVWWMVGVMFQSAAILTATNILDLTPDKVGFALLPIVVFMGIGCFVVGWISNNRIELGLIPFGAVGMFIFGVIFWLATPVPNELVALKQEFGRIPQVYVILLPALMGVVGFMSGFFIVPLEAFVMHASDPKSRGGVWATCNVLTAIGMISGAILPTLIIGQSKNPATVFLVGGIIMLLAGIIISWRFPRIPLRFMIVLFLRVIYKTRSKGVENIPETGGALLAPNHQSYLDGILLTSIIDRPIRFIMSQEVYNTWFVYPFARLTHSIPIERTQSPRELIQALRSATQEIEEGGLVCIFPEGQLTRNGVLQPLKRGIERIMKDLDAPIIPIGIDGAFETAAAVPSGKWRLSRVLELKRRAINVSIGIPLNAGTPLPVLRRAITHEIAEAFEFRKEDTVPLHRMALQSLKKSPFSKRYSDHSTDGLVPNIRLLIGVYILGTRLKSIWKGQKCVGIFLPPSIGATVINITALTAGRVPVNLNYTASTSILKGICDSSRIKVILTSRLFMEKVSVDLPEGPRVIYLEDLREGIAKKEILAAIFSTIILPVSTLERILGRKKSTRPDDVASLIFSSGSTGVPKGVMLTHWNIWSNCVGTLHYVDTGNSPRFLGILPFFHSFGFMSTLWLPFMKNLSVVFYPNPLDGRAVGVLVERYEVTHLFGTPTFLSSYTRRVSSEQFGSLRFVLTGAEKLRTQTADQFEEKFGLRPVEGFGCTETSPVTAINGANYREPGIFQRGVKEGTVGQPIPGVLLSIRDLDSGEEVAPGETGMLHVKGPNVMKGYFKMREKTSEVLVDGWYQTGDVARVDEDGFLMITDRLARFSKIGGEMVPHVKIEEHLQSLVDAEEQVFAVTGVPDDKKGEKLMVLYTTSEARAKEACEKLADPELNIPGLWRPKWNDFLPIEEIPLLGSGKMDLRKMKELALEYDQNKND